MKTFLRRLIVAAEYAFLVAAFLIPASSIVFGATVNFSAPILQLDGSSPKDASGKDAPVSLGKVAIDALLAPYPDEPTLPGDEKIKRYLLASKIQNAAKGNVDLTTDEIELIKKLVAKGWPALVVGQAWSILDPASVKK